MGATFKLGPHARSVVRTLLLAMPMVRGRVRGGWRVLRAAATRAAARNHAVGVGARRCRAQLRAWQCDAAGDAPRQSPQAGLAALTVLRAGPNPTWPPTRPAGWEVPCLPGAMALSRGQPRRRLQRDRRRVLNFANVPSASESLVCSCCRVSHWHRNVLYQPNHRSHYDSSDFGSSQSHCEPPKSRSKPRMALPCSGFHSIARLNSLDSRLCHASRCRCCSIATAAMSASIGLAACATIESDI
jgi:hypothetical protein